MTLLTDTIQDDSAANALLSANKTLSNSGTLRRKSRQSSIPERPRFDTLGRRVVEPLQRTPLGSRMNSSTSARSAGSSGTPTPSDGPPEVVSASDIRWIETWEGRETHSLGRVLVEAVPRVPWGAIG